MRAFISAHKHTILPSPPERGRGVGGEGASPPKTCRRSPLTSPPAAAVQIHRHLCGLCALCGSKNTPHTRLSRAELGLESPSHGEGCSRVFHPSPPSPLPFQGRGVPVRFTLQPKHKILPSPLSGGEGGQFQP